MSDEEAISIGKRKISASVREVVSFVLRAGDLRGTAGFSGRNRALDGTRGHQKLQKRRPEGYKAEVPVRWETDRADFLFELKGRIDGVGEELGTLVIEEIKTVRRSWNGPAEPLHLAQGKLYAYLYAEQNGFERVVVRITYFDLVTEEASALDYPFAIRELKDFFDTVLGEYLQWMEQHQSWCQARDLSIQNQPFPFPKYREGQRSLAVAAYRSIKAGGKLFAEAPTGIGKTVSVLFPAIKLLGEGKIEKIFYLTAKTIGRQVAEDTFARLRSSGVRVRALTLTAREKICVRNGEPCDITSCPMALGYYDRLKGALRDALQNDAFTRHDIEFHARKHNVCPFEFSLDLSEWVDAIICDYNYVFDPNASLSRYFDGEKHDYAILVDEAHNLVDRGRQMFSAELNRRELLKLKDALKPDLPVVARALGQVCSALSAMKKEEGWTERAGVWISKNAPEKLGKALEKFLDAAELWLAQEQHAGFQEELLTTYFETLCFRRVLEMFDERFIAISDPSSEMHTLFCLDASALLADALKAVGAAVLFSATLRPADYFRQALGGGDGDPFLQLNSPFPAENLHVLVHDGIATRFNMRALTYDAIVEAILAFTEDKPGNYMVFFSSHAYLAEVYSRFRERSPSTRTQVQSSNMAEDERERFIAAFAADQSVVGFAVLGGLFGEGIDLVGDRLIGVVVVGVGLPQVCLERELIKEHYHTENSGFDYAYTFPGFNKVLQGVGRLIRSETDRGMVLLIDERFGRLNYRQLFPKWWSVMRVRSADDIRGHVGRFWGTPTDASGRLPLDTSALYSDLMIQNS